MAVDTSYNDFRWDTAYRRTQILDGGPTAHATDAAEVALFAVDLPSYVAKRRGAEFKIEITADVKSQATEVLLLTLRLAGIDLVALTHTDINESSVTPLVYTAWGRFHTLGAGTTAAIVATARSVFTVNGAATEVMGNTAVGGVTNASIDTSIPMKLDVTADWTDSSADNSIQVLTAHMQWFP